MPGHFMYRYYVTPNFGGTKSESTTTLQSSHRDETTFYWMIPCFGALCIGFSLVGVFTVAVMLPAALFRLHKTHEYVNIHANHFKHQTNNLWFELGRVQKQWRLRRDHVYTNQTELPALPVLPVPQGFIPFPFHKIEIRRRPQPSDRFVPNDSNFDFDDNLEDTTIPEKTYFTTQNEYSERTTVSQKQIFRVTVKPRPRPVPPLSMNSLTSDKARQTFDYYHQHLNNPPATPPPPIFYPPPPPMPTYTKSSGYVTQCIGPPGPPGADAEDGPDGATGPNGAPGADAIFERLPAPCQICPQGARGPIGAPGPAGSTGYGGSPGYPGSTGEPGAQPDCPGPQGYPGFPGPKGIPGEQGAPGVDWVSGIGAPGGMGSVGSVGPQGPPGLPGKSALLFGVPGPAGDPGGDGWIGADGLAGPPGPPGEPGIDKGYCPCPFRNESPYVQPRQSNYGRGRKSLKS
ncbi:unnamed protein product [Bursaphelenchus okinawaensis]|uniref:Col_cuticle_N domain-containing protein n=1 Tax=Bursaphelenchus okinawaensis TaxID=465554 RepID=A0A811L8F4_9BILA|nr:unnamed protein product [Bursaphelenchus okinawaensis]CAG9121064.1 unnamed protein product [Bursaphelenchus okinawaensis]